MKTYIPIILFFGLLLNFSCKEKKGNKIPVANGKPLMEANCNACHNPKTSKNSAIAPPMIHIKEVYKEKYNTQKEFINAFVSWNKNPNKENSLMPNSIKKYGIMAKLGFSENQITEIAKYIFNNDIEKPKWYGSMHSTDTLSAAEKNKIKNGMQIIRATKKELGKNLMGQINKNGTLSALDFCNLNAMKITNNMANKLEATIKRVSDKPRNKNNQANTLELDYIKYFKNKISKNESIDPIVTSKDSVHTIYLPITTNSMCLQCHGEPKQQIKPKVFAKLNDKYPLDMAIGYKENQVRGIWVVDFK